MTIHTDDMTKVQPELQSHQIKLELQNQEPKNAQHDLMASRDDYAQFYYSAPIGYLVLDKHQVISKANPTAAHLLGISEQSLINKTLGQFIHSLDQDRYQLFLDAVLNKLTASALILRSKNLSIQPIDIACQGIQYCNCTPATCSYKEAFSWLEVRSIFVKNDEEDINEIVLSLIDVTEAQQNQKMIVCLNEKLEQKIVQQTRELKEANQDLTETIKQLKIFETEITEREAKLNAIFNAAVEGIITINLSGIIISANNAVENIFGFDNKDIIGCYIRKLIPLMSDQIEGLGNRTSKLIGNISEQIGLHKNGMTFPLEASMAEFSIKNQTYRTIIVRDISFRKMRERLDKQHLDALAHVTRLGLLGELASGIAHEVNQPLTAIMSYTEAGLNLMSRDKYNQELLRNILEKSSQQASRAGQIIHRMRNLVKTNHIHQSTTNINDLIEDAVGLCASYIKQNSIQLRLLLANNLPMFNIDFIQIEQVLLNLIKNSIDALSLVPISKPRVLSIETVLNEDHAIEIRVKDNGTGIKHSEQSNILTPFYTTKGEGMGMGLSICRSIIETHGGVLRFNSLPEKGTTFYFTLPLRK